MILVVSFFICSPLLARKVRGALYTHPDKLFSVEVPQGWSVGKDAQDITVLSKRTGGGTTFQENVKIVATPVREGVTLDRYIENSLEKNKDSWNVEKREKVTIDGVDARRFIIEQKLPVSTARVVKCFLIKGGHIFVITCAAEPGAFKASLPVFEKILGTFKAFPSH
jgi:hypothetical protein